MDGELVVVLGSAKDAFDELLHALELVRVYEVVCGACVEPIEGGFFRRGGLSGRGGVDACKLDQHRGHCAFAAAAEIIIAGKRKSGFSEFAEDLKDQGKPRHGTVDLLGRLLPGFLGRVNFRLREHTNRILHREKGAASNDQIGILHVENWKITPEIDAFAAIWALSALFRAWDVRIWPARESGWTLT